MASIAQIALGAYENRDAIKRICLWIGIILGSILFFLYLMIAVTIAVIQGNANIGDAPPNTNVDTQYTQFSYKTFFGTVFYQYIHPYFFPTLGSLTQGVIYDGRPKVGKTHIAWDIADTPARQTEIRSFADGRVIQVKNNILHNTTLRWKFCDGVGGICWYVVANPGDVQIGCGYEVIIQHADSLRSEYCHMQSPTFVNVGDTVTGGQVIGFQGATGWATGKHLHFAIFRGGQPIDPGYAFTQTGLSDWSTSDISSP